MPPKVIVEPSPHEPSDWEPADATAIQACFNGTANAEQQQRAIKWILYGPCAVDDIEYRTNDRDHAYVSGKRNVGLQIRKLNSINVAAMIVAKRDSNRE